MEPQSPANAQLHSVWSEKRLIAICLFIALAQFQYGYDSAAIAGFQSMPGFLAVFGYVDVSPCPRACKWMDADRTFLT